MGYYIMVGMSRIACYDDNSFTYIITYLFSCLSKYYHYNIIRTTEGKLEHIRLCVQFCLCKEELKHVDDIR